MTKFADYSKEGWYLAGVVVRPERHRRGIGHGLTLAGLAWIAARRGKAYYFVNEMNQASIDLHAAARKRDPLRVRSPETEGSG